MQMPPILNWAPLENLEHNNPVLFSDEISRFVD